MPRVVFFCISLFLWSAPVQVWAQIDSDLIKGTKEAPQDDGLATGRYEIRKAPPLETTDRPPTKKTIKKKSSRKVSSEEPVLMANEPAHVASPNGVQDSKGDSKTLSSEDQVKAPTMSEQVSGLIAGGNMAALQAYREQVHPDDIRLNRLEINVVPGFLYHESKSSYSYRNYFSFSPYVALGARIWLTPFIGISGKYGTSMGADILESSGSTTRIAVTHEASEVGLNFRNFFGLSRRSNSLDLGVYYSEVKFSVPGDNLKRIKTKSTGLGLKFEARIPTAPSYAWILGGKIEPRNSQSELASGLNLQSGTSPQSSKVGINLGGEIKMSRQHQLIFDLGVSVEKIEFTGSASQADPESLQTPTGVSVTNTQTLLSLGYRWGH